MKSELQEFYNSRWEVIEKSGLDLTLIDSTKVHDDVEKLHDDIFMLIGEAPASEEARTGRPFQGKAGENLNKLIALSRFERHENFLVCNAFPFRCFKIGATGEINRNPNGAELKEGSELLKREISIIKPKAIIALGGSALKALKHLGIKDMKIGDSGEYEGIPLFIVNHPSPLAYNQKKYRDALEAFFKGL